MPEGFPDMYTMYFEVQNIQPYVRMCSNEGVCGCCGYISSYEESRFFYFLTATAILGAGAVGTGNWTAGHLCLCACLFVHVCVCSACVFCLCFLSVVPACLPAWLSVFCLPACLLVYVCCACPRVPFAFCVSVSLKGQWMPHILTEHDPRSKIALKPKREYYPPNTCTVSSTKPVCPAVLHEQYKVGARVGLYLGVLQQKTPRLPFYISFPSRPPSPLASPDFQASVLSPLTLPLAPRSKYLCDPNHSNISHL